MPEELLITPKEREKVVKRVKEHKDELRELIEQLQKEMEMINKARAIVRAEKLSFLTPKKNAKFLEEIKVPALKILKDKSSEK